ncbi:MAG: hypothetical protein Q9159_001722 [Coniocarpon cinnabarinum]
MYLKYSLTTLLTTILSFTSIARAATTTQGRNFVYNGAPKYLAGTNAYWLSLLQSNANVDAAMAEIAASKAFVVRVWAFSDVNTPSDDIYFQQISADLSGNKTKLNEGPNGITHLDYAIQSAERHGLQLILPLLNGNPDFGGVNAYCTVFNCDSTTFWTSEPAQAAYLNWTETVITRYRNSPAIFAWELCNEPRCPGCDTNIIHDWAATVSAHIKSLDPAHLVALGDEGWLCAGGDGSYPYQCTNGVDFEKNLGIATLDFGTFHLYPDAWSESLEWGNTWITDHDAIGARVGKPVVLEEYGAVVGGEVDASAEEGWQATVLKSNVAMDLYWQFADSALDEGKEDQYSVQVGASDFGDLATGHANAMVGKAVG